ncbi:MAG TPA: flagellar filament capping protein FliD [Campylobacterales bacterium]|nr:flagellar filament capping protein FliD [Campylobacterales bacterium]
MANIHATGYGSSIYAKNLFDGVKSKTKEEKVERTPDATETTQSTTVDASAKLTEAVSSIKSNVTGLVNDSSYIKRVATSSSTDVSLSVSDGAQVQDSTINVSELAQNHIMQSGRFSARDAAVVSTYDATFKMSVNNQSYSVDVKAGTTLEQFVQKINDATGGAVTAGILDTGAAKNPYVMTLKANNTGLANKITIDSTFDIGLTTKKTLDSTVKSGSAQIADGELSINGVNISMAATKATNTSEDNALAIVRAINTKSAETGVRAYTYITDTDKVRKIGFKNLSGGEMNIVASDAVNELMGKTQDTDGDGNMNTDISRARLLQAAKDAKFTFNGELMTRSGNEATDVIEGGVLKLNKASGVDINLSVSQELSGIPALVDSFTSSFNALSSETLGLTKQDSLKVSALYDAVGSLIAEKSADGVSLSDYGFSINTDGAISVDKTALNSGLSANSSASETLFKSVFAKIDSALNTTLESSVVVDPEENDKDKHKHGGKDKFGHGDRFKHDERDKKAHVIKNLVEKYKESENRFENLGSIISKFQQVANSIKKEYDDMR